MNRMLVLPIQRKLTSRVLVFFSVPLILLFAGSKALSQNSKASGKNYAKTHIKAVNEAELPRGTKKIAIVGATVIDGTGGQPLENAVVLIQENKIISVGNSGTINLPKGTEVVDAKGLFLLPGLIDAHFHLDEIKGLPHQFLRNGVTAVRDPGEWIEMYNDERTAPYAVPRLFLTGPHLDMAPPAYPKDAYVVRDGEEAVRGVNKFADQGASAIKIYFRLSLGIMQKVCEAAHKRGLPVTAHLELSDAKDVIAAGADGIEHVTSFGVSLLPAVEAEQYKQAVLADNNARKKGRYEVWNTLNIHSGKVDSLLTFLKNQKTFISPTLGVFEYRFGEGKNDTVQANGFQNMLAFVGRAKKAGVRVVVGSHSMVPYALQGWAYQREMELLAESGMTSSEIIVAATMENARFFRVDDRLGSIEKGKIADLILVKENPLADIKAMRNIERVMLNGVWVD
jgi:imidazolonepropionase-like amidohydrolase